LPPENRDLAASQVETKGLSLRPEAAYATTTASGVPEEMHKAELDYEASKQAFEAEQKVVREPAKSLSAGCVAAKGFDQARVSPRAKAKSQLRLPATLECVGSCGQGAGTQSASGQLESARGKYLGSQAQLSYSEIRSPDHGVVLERASYPGEIATAGAPLLNCHGHSAVIAKGHIPHQDAALLKVGNAAELIRRNEGTIPAKITVVTPATDPNSTTVEVWPKH